MAKVGWIVWSCLGSFRRTGQGPFVRSGLGPFLRSGLGSFVKPSQGSSKFIRVSRWYGDPHSSLQMIWRPESVSTTSVISSTSSSNEALVKAGCIVLRLNFCKESKDQEYYVSFQIGVCIRVFLRPALRVEKINALFRNPEKLQSMRLKKNLSDFS